ncbi:protein phosphatase 2C domain-containing protein [Amycolatopsis sp., V23-08]|uniref:Protein phosphatase 2C domain-containing protein n=1 Tax=Amycolatopsis heterodermiae TaxID=3110235 RepID=A0ABU5R0N5_9PSEU|nr:protein phosphatase 2C domain-containing protein [Amycolatopsis sp., V23-08]MEA5359399.1 protein phosphatase 2C domain-containing protein [Amycolatopsis sp., V23-08]
MTHDRYVLRYAAGSDVGRRRRINEDSLYASARLLAVADGIGGQPHGEVASATAVDVLRELDVDLRRVDLTTIDLTATLAGVVKSIGERLTEVAAQEPTTEGMGTTLTTLLFDGVTFAAAHVGDSRGYLLRDGGLRRLTRDHTLVQALVEDGRVAAEDAASHPRRSLLMRALQTTGSSDPDIWTFKAKPGDRYLLCSDGLSGPVTEQTLRDTLESGTDPAELVPELIRLANEGGGPDNITCVIADVTA